MKLIPLINSNKYMKVSNKDYAYLSMFSWSLSNKGYAWWRYMIDKTQYIIHSHHLIVGFPSKGLECDHINGNRLDNRRENLRLVSRNQNQYNRKPQKNILGVHLETLKGGYKYWRAVIYKNNKRKHLGYFKFKTDAIHARRMYERKNNIITQP